MRSMAGPTGYPPSALTGRYPRGGPAGHIPYRTPTIHSGNPFEDLITMGTTTSSETIDYAEHLRSQRKTTQDDVDRAAAEHDVDDFTARERWSSVAY